MLALAQYQALATRLKAPVAHVMAVADVESSGETFWTIDGKQMPAVRLEAHHFGARTGYRYNDAYPFLSSREWNPALAATSRAGAWAQVSAAAALDRTAAYESTSWGPFQVMGFNWHGLGYASVTDMVAGMWTEAGQIEAFARYIEADPVLQRALARGDWQTFEERYNGTGAGGAYARRIALAVERFADGPRAPPRALRSGDHGADVADLQRALKLAVANGNFGPETERAVRVFQALHGLVVDGIAGAMTKQAMV